MSKYDTIIIGGGISGLSFATALKKNNIHDVCIIEKESIGGCIKTQNYKDIWLELGAHTIYNSYQNTIDLIDNIDINNDIVKRKKLPFLFANENKLSSIFSNLNIFSLLFSYLKNRKLNKEGRSISSYASKVFGKANYTNTLKYCFDAVLSQDSSNFPMEFLFKKYPRNKKYPRSFTLKDGLSGLTKNHDIKTIIDNVVSITKNENGGWTISTKNKSLECENVVFATDWQNTSSLLKNIPTMSPLTENKFQPSVSNILSIGVVFKKDDLTHIKDLAGIIGKNNFFFSAVSRDIIEHSKFRAIAFHCKLESKSDNVNQDTIDKFIEKIAAFLDVDETKILDIKYRKNTLPMYNLEHSKFIQALDKSIKDHNLYITGNYFDRLAIENCIKRSNEEVKRLISKR